MEKHILSKSTFIKGYHCLKSLYLYKKRPFLRDRISPEQRAKFKRGHEVGDLAQLLFPGGIDVSPKSPSQYQKSVLRTLQLIEERQEVIYEATFQFNQVLIMLDILVKKADGWHGFEVKSSKKLSETYFTDSALQYWVIVNSGINLQSFSLIYVNENYRLLNRLNLSEYFIFKDVTDEVKSRQDFIENKVQEEKDILAEKHSPKIAVGKHCFNPYKCDFVGFCWKKIADKPYLAKEISIEKPILKKNIPPFYLSLIFSEQAIPLCKNEKAYNTQILGFQFSGSAAKLLINTCEGKKKLIADFIHEALSLKRIITFNQSRLHNYLAEVSIVYPEYKDQVSQIKKKTLGLIDILEDKKLIPVEKKALYTAAWFSKAFFEKESNLHKLPVFSDILARALYDESKADLLNDEHPDLSDLKAYLSEQIVLLELLYKRM
jgi:hypothetical protein